MVQKIHLGKYRFDPLFWGTWKKVSLIEYCYFPHLFKIFWKHFTSTTLRFTWQGSLCHKEIEIDRCHVFFSKNVLMLVELMRTLHFWIRTIWHACVTLNPWNCPFCERGYDFAHFKISQKYWFSEQMEEKDTLPRPYLKQLSSKTVEPPVLSWN